jgi:hypothetical protein
VSHLGNEFLAGIVSLKTPKAPVAHTMCTGSWLSYQPGFLHREDPIGEDPVNSFLLAISTGVTSAHASLGAGVWVGVAFVFGLTFAGYWRILAKVNEPGWAILIPIYGMVKLLHISRQSGWWALLACVPYLGVIATIVLSISLARVFGKGVLFGIGLLLLPFLFAPILGFGSAEYIGPAPAGADLPREELGRVY